VPRFLDGIIHRLTALGLIFKARAKARTPPNFSTISRAGDSCLDIFSLEGCKKRLKVLYWCGIVNMAF